MGIEVPTSLKKMFMANLSGKNIPCFYFFSVTGKTEKSEVFSPIPVVRETLFQLSFV